MNKLLLNQGWRLDYEGETLNSQIPFSLYYDLLNHKRIDDPFYRDNATLLTSLSEKDYTYRNDFIFKEEIDERKQYFLHFDRVDTISNVYLNDIHVGYTDNMFCTFEFPVNHALKKGTNHLRVEFESPIHYMNEQIEKNGRIPCNTDTLDGFPYLRKSSCMSGWDWAPRLPDMGIYKEASVVVVEKGRLSNVHIRQQHMDGRVTLNLFTEHDINGAMTGDAEKIETLVRITDPEGRLNIYGNSPENIEIENPRVWWPNGLGDQPLYQVEVEFYIGGELQDVYSTRIGLRTMTMAVEKDEWGESFAHEVNGVKVFAMGADYIPEDCLVPRVNRETTKKLLTQCIRANYNAVRVWGGGYYPDDDFFDLCDEMGLIVWQDGMFCCSTYLLTPEFEENITKELVQNVRRLRHHACLGLWSGNNELEELILAGEYGSFEETVSLRADYIKIFEYIIPKIIKSEDPDTFYWPSSPSSGGGYDFPNDPNRGDAHYWAVWHGFKPFTEYRKQMFRYASEFGFEAMPAYKTIESFTGEEDRNLFSYVMERHQRSNMGYAKMMNYMAQTFLYPTDLKTLVYASQLMQGEAMKYAVEHWRRHRGRCMGAIVWQLNDCWPVTSWSSIDYFGRWKALHYYEKRFFAPIMISCEEEGQLSQNPNINTRPYPLEKSFRLNVANETMNEQLVKVRYSLRNAKSEIIGKEMLVERKVSAMSTIWLDKVDCPEASLYEDHVHFACEQGGVVISEGTAIFTMPKFYRYEQPELSWRMEGADIIITAEAYAKSVEILNENEDLVLTDNYFDMEAGEKRVSIISGSLKGLRLRSVYDIR